MSRKPLLFAAVLLATTACPPAWSRDLVGLDVIDRDAGHWLPAVRARGHAWVAGTPGHRYAVRLTNTTGERVLVVLSVDGVNAVSGETAEPAQAGYVLGPWQSAEITGWRKSLEDVAHFVFTDLPDSYAARTGRPGNVGVIGIAVFREARPAAWAPPPPSVTRESARDAPRAAAPAAEAEGHGAMAKQRIGTGHGAREWSPVGRTEFVRASRAPVQTTELRYEDRNALVAMGVLASPGGVHPRAFPGGFVADPPR